MIGNERYDLPSIIGNDLIRHAKISLLLFAILISAILVVTTVYKTRLLTTQHAQLMLERDVLDIEWRNLILEENMLGYINRIEHIATEMLQMQHVDSTKENIVVQP